jgi:hypothetical protein
MVGYCKNLDDLLMRKEVYAIDDDGVGECGGMLIILWLYPRVEVLGCDVDGAMFVKVINDLVFD